MLLCALRVSIYAERARIVIISQRTRNSGEEEDTDALAAVAHAHGMIRKAIISAPTAFVRTANSAVL